MKYKMIKSKIMKQQIMIILCCILIICSFAGCKLAREDLSTDLYEDKLIGILVTTKYLDLFNFDDYLSDNLNSFKDGNITFDDNTQKYQGRLYAVLTTKVLTDEETGEKVETKEYVFDETIGGIPYYYCTIHADDENGSYITSVSDEAISEGHMNINIDDNKNGVSLEGTIYAAPSSKNHEYYFNPIYQSLDGSMYAVSGSGYMVSDDSYSEGAAYSQMMEDTYTVTENGKEKIDSMSIKINISIMNAPEKIVILQMDMDSKILSRKEYEPSKLPEAIILETDTDYIIVETYKHDNTKSLTISRKIYSKDDNAIDTFYVREDGICIKKWTQIN